MGDRAGIEHADFAETLRAGESAEDKLSRTAATLEANL